MLRHDEVLLRRGSNLHLYHIGILTEEVVQSYVDRRLIKV